MKIMVISRLRLEEFKNNPNANINDYNIISIYSSNKSATPVFDKELQNVLTLKFDDIIDVDYQENNSQYKKIHPNESDMCLFDRDMARRVIYFLRKIDKNKFLICQCDAGRSRSGAIGKFANEMINKNTDDYEIFYLVNKHITPNSFVFKTLMFELNDKAA